MCRSPLLSFFVSWPAVLLGVLSLATSGCSIRRLAVNSLADALAASGDVYASDEDPELVREALPFALKTIESLLAEAPEHRGLLLAATRGFTGYAYAFVDTEAERVRSSDYGRAVELAERALKLYLRARDYGLTALDLEVPGTSERLKTEPAAAAAAFGREHVPLLYWTGAAWGAAISVGLDRPEVVADVAAAEALLTRVLVLDETYEDGAVHEALLGFAATPEAMGGSEERARRHFERAVELSGGDKAGPYVALAEHVSVANQDRREFERLLEQALAVDPDVVPAWRLANLVAQRRARSLLARADELFLEDVEEPAEDDAVP